ncbi:MAG: hypothetical protein FD167_4819 [bacterium]|nr:MAG: hypothetical protein FD167_4819 [bacterium]
MALNVPKLTGNTVRELFQEAVKHVKELNGTAKEKAELFEALGKQINQRSGYSWMAYYNEGTDESHIFTGTLAAVLVVSPDGRLFRGSLQQGSIKVGVKDGKPIYTPIYELMKEI